MSRITKHREPVIFIGEDLATARFFANEKDSFPMFV